MKAGDKYYWSEMPKVDELTHELAIEFAKRWYKGVAMNTDTIEGFCNWRNSLRGVLEETLDAEGQGSCLTLEVILAFIERYEREVGKSQAWKDLIEEIAYRKKKFEEGSQ